MTTTNLVGAHADPSGDPLEIQTSRVFQRTENKKIQAKTPKAVLASESAQDLANLERRHSISRSRSQARLARSLPVLGNNALEKDYEKKLAGKEVYLILAVIIYLRRCT